MSTTKPLILISPQILERIQTDIDKDLEFKKKLREHLDDLDRRTRMAMALLSQFHSSAEGQISLARFDPVMRQQLDELLGHTHNSSLKDSLTTIKTIANEKPYYKYNQIWSKYMENISFCYVLKYYIEEEKLMSYDEVAERMGVPTDEDDMHFHLSIEEYLHSLISLINELSRLAINSVTMGNYSRPLQISKFVKELSTAFSILNLKNDNLRKRFDSIKYDVKKIEEGRSLFPVVPLPPPCPLSTSLSPLHPQSTGLKSPMMNEMLMVVVYDLSLRGLVPKKE